MLLRLRALMVLVVLVFAAETVVQAAAATQMRTDSAAEAAMAMAGGEHAPGCDGCNGDSDDATTCLAACTLLVLAMVGRVVDLAPATQALIRPVTALPLRGRSQAPDPYPPSVPF